MTFKELEAIIGKQDQKLWVKHPNGGGWVAATAKVDASAFIGGNAWVSENAQVYGDARVHGNAQVSGDAWVKPVLFLLDSRGHGCTNCKHGWLKIGCEEHTFKEWRSKFRAIARKHTLTKVEFKEYKAIVGLFSKVGL